MGVVVVVVLMTAMSANVWRRSRRRMLANIWRVDSYMIGTLLNILYLFSLSRYFTPIF